MRSRLASANQAFAESQESMDRAEAKTAETRAPARADKRRGNGQGPGPSGPDLSQVAARSNLNETAFFFPHLISNKDGEVKLEFQMPEALTLSLIHI